MGYDAKSCTRHVELLLEHMELDGTEVKGVYTPGGKSRTNHDETELGSSRVTLYRSCMMLLENFSAYFVFVVLCESVGTWHGLADNRTLESSEGSCGLSEDAGFNNFYFKNRQA